MTTPAIPLNEFDQVSIHPTFSGVMLVEPAGGVRHTYPKAADCRCEYRQADGIVSAPSCGAEWGIGETRDGFSRLDEVRPTSFAPVGSAHPCPLRQAATAACICETWSLT